MTDPQVSHKLINKDKIDELVQRLRGTGGLPLSPSYTKSLKAWLAMIASRGWLEESFLCNKDVVVQTFKDSFPNPGTRSNFSRAVLMYFSALTDDEFAATYPKMTRREAVSIIRAVATEANKGVNNRSYRKSETDELG